MSENIRTGIFVAIWTMSLVIFLFDHELGIFLMVNVVLWAVLEQSIIISKSLRELIRILGKTRSKNV